MESLGARGWLKRKNRKALRRLRSILEEGRDRGTRADRSPAGSASRPPASASGSLATPIGRLPRPMNAARPSPLSPPPPLGIGGCGDEDGSPTARPRATYVTVDGLSYQVQISRQLNPTTSRTATT